MSNKIFGLCFYSFILVVISLKGVAQDIPFDATSHIKSYTVSPPDVYSFEKYKINPLNHYTGKANVNIPIYTINTGNISYPISLNYDTGGIKVDQLASNVGLGWNLSRTVITRTVNQNNDFNNLGNNKYDNAISTSDPYYYSYSPSEHSKELSAWLEGSENVGYFLAKRRGIPMSGSNKNVDLLPDTYNFYTHTSSISFFFTDPTTPVEITPKGTLINAVRGKQTFDTHYASIYPITNNAYPTQDYYDFPTQDFFSITVLTNDGIKYIFNDYDLSATFDYTSTKNYFAPAQVSAWHISQIIDTSTGKSITFEYDTTSSNPYEMADGIPLTEDQMRLLMNGTQDTFNYTAYPTQNGNLSCNDYYFKEEYYPRSTNRTRRIDVQLKRLKSISFDEGEIKFYYNGDSASVPDSGGARLDIYAGDFLTGVELKNKNSDVVNSFQLSYDYFQSDYGVGEFNENGYADYSDYRYKRLKLTGFQERGKPAYKFTYDESVKLPPINSFSVDFLGYFNGSPDVLNTAQIDILKPNPKLYYYPNKYEYSLLPFPVAGTSYSTINGYFDRTANNNSKAWTLTKIQYPTGGELEFVYEPNTFEVFGKTITGGGVRIAKQLLRDGYGGVQTVEYGYNKGNGISSGKLSSIPFFGHPTKKFFDVTSTSDPFSFTPLGTSTNVVDWKLFDKSNLNADISIGAYIGYSRITEKEVGNGYKEFKFTSNEEPDNRNLIQRTNEGYVTQTTTVSNTYNCSMANFLILNSGIGANIFTDNSYRRGKLLEENIFSEAGGWVQKTHFTYADYTNGNYQFSQPINRPVQSYSVENNVVHLLTAFKYIKASNYLPSQKTVTSFDGSNEYQIVENYTYTDYGMVKTKALTDNGGVDIQKTTFYYPKDVVSTNSLPGGILTFAELTSLLAMKNASHNYISVPLQVDQHKNTTLKYRSRKLFTRHAAFDRILPSTSHIAFGDNPLQLDFEFHRYDLLVSKPFEISQKSGPKTVLIWGYNKTKLIAKIENLVYNRDILSSIIIDLQALSDIEYTKETEENLRVALNNLRSIFPDSLVTTYTYDPLVGVKSITDARGKCIFYTYDSFNRLKFVKDNDGNVLSSKDYNYKQ
ncbi:hypothetical protein ACI6PS_06850 [Flavobacterium sp. PLA-1-15]|uniref:hypothetical protein n=1 Tax=Flavobacterium sp. PLA-1-15 TaxID=3380533 RepID=UPI003B75EA26